MQQLEMQQKQIQKLNQQLRQSLKVLSMSGSDIADMVERELLENPLIEAGSCPDSEKFEANWISQRPSAGNSEISALDLAAAGQSMHARLEEQFGQVAASKDEKRIAEYLIGSLDESGFLTIPLAQLAAELAVDSTVIEAVRQKIINLDPVGFATTGPIEYLCKQLEQLDLDHSLRALAVWILTDYLSLLIDNDTAELCACTGATEEEVHRALHLIRSLNPRPANAIETERSVNTVPDVIFYKQESGIGIALNPYYYPRLNVVNTYQDKIAELDKPTVKYIRGKIREASFFNYCILQREETMRNIAAIVLSRQRDFFDKGLLFMHPLRLKEVAQELSVHESTVCRAIGGKYAQTPHGTFSMKIFFPMAIKTMQGSLTPAQIKSKIVELLRTTDKKPADRIIAERLALGGIVLARRTVAKYCAELGLKNKIKK